MITELVACPICSRQMPESDINLHLDLNCPGEASSSTPKSVTRTKPEASQSSLRSSPEGGVIEIADTPPRPASGTRNQTTNPANVASIFGPRKRMKLDSEVEAGPIQTSNRPSVIKRPQPRVVKEEDAQEKKVRVNPLLANQPYVNCTFDVDEEVV